jgi:hypothetical protein
LQLCFFTGMVAVVIAGCGSQPSGSGPSAAVEPTVTPAPAEPAPAPQAADEATPPAPEVKEPPKTSAKEEPARSAPRKVNAAEEAAVKKITAIIQDSVDIGPTLVVWIIDRTPSAKDIVREVANAAQNFYETPQVGEWSAAEGKPLLTAIATFDSDVQFILDPPASDWQQVQKAFAGIKPSSAPREMTFAAIKKALEKYLPLRTDERRELLFVVVTNEAGDDPKLVDELLEPTRRQAIPVYAIGLPAPWGQTSPLAKDPKATEPPKDDNTPTVGPESLHSERVDIGVWAGSAAAKTNIDLVDSGFGPFALERLCRASRGQFFPLRGHKGVGAKTWPSGGELRFDDKVVSKYAPDYVPEADYKKQIGENKARAALAEAAKLPKLVLEGTPGSRFPKEAEAKMAQKMSQAQQFAARNLPAVERLCDLLTQGESDRAKLTSPRWQAEFDLAIGRALAMRARLDGYNSMIAALKRGKTFQNAESKAWVLESADNFETESTIKKMADKAKMYLDRVVQEHPGTPWAKIAELELKTPLGWAWKEAS